jgi:hypothetical protein
VLRRLFLLIATAAVLAGCGNARTPPPDIDHAVDPTVPKEIKIRDTGIAFTAPANWQAVPAVGSLVGGVKSKTATVAVWRYPREEPLPKGEAELAEARRRLIEHVSDQDPTLDLRRRKLRKHGIELVGTQTIAGVPVGIRSVHVFHNGAEVVVDAYAPPEDFDRVDESVFRPLIRSLRVTAP